MKRIVFPLLVCLSICITYINCPGATAKAHPLDEKATHALEILRIAYETMKHDAPEYVEVSHELRHENGLLTGWEFISHTPDMPATLYAQLELYWNADNIPMGAFKDANGLRKVILKWDDERITWFNITSHSLDGFTVHYNKDGSLDHIMAEGAGDAVYTFTYAFNDQHLTQLTTDITHLKDKKNITRIEKHIAYEPGRINVQTETSRFVKKGSSYAVYQKAECTFEKPEDRHYVVNYATRGRSAVRTNQDVRYNEAHQLVLKEIYNDDAMLRESYVYKGSKIARKELKEYKGGNFIAHTVTTHEAGGTVTRKFDVHGKPISETQNGKTRKMIDGAWTDWQVASR